MFKYVRIVSIALAAVIIGLVTGAGRSTAAESCQLKLRASVPITVMSPVETGLIPANIGGKLFRMLLDTGAVSTVIEGKAALAVGWKPRRATSRIVGIGGEADVSPYIMLPMVLDHTRVAVPLAMITDPEKLLYQNAFDGLLGLDVLNQFDFEIDPVGKKLNLFAQDHCPGKVVYWANDYSTIPFVLSHSGHLQVTVHVDGHPVRGIIDTGYSHTSMRWNTASDLFGLKATSPGVYALPKATMSSDGKLIEGAQYTFDSLEFGDLRILHAVVNLLPQYSTNAFTDMFGMDDWGPQIVIGMDVLEHLRFYVSKIEKTIYFTIVTPTPVVPTASPS